MSICFLWYNAVLAVVSWNQRPCRKTVATVDWQSYWTATFYIIFAFRISGSDRMDIQSYNIIFLYCWALHLSLSLFLSRYLPIPPCVPEAVFTFHLVASYTTIMRCGKPFTFVSSLDPLVSPPHTETSSPLPHSLTLGDWGLGKCFVF